MQKPAAEGDYLHELGKTTQEIVSLVLEHQRNTGSGGTLPVPGCNVVDTLPSLPHLSGLADLKATATSGERSDAVAAAERPEGLHEAEPHARGGEGQDPGDVCGLLQFEIRVAMHPMHHLLMPISRCYVTLQRR